MAYHFLKVCAATPKLAVGDCKYNTEQILHCLERSSEDKASLTLFPELCITGYTCANLFFQTTLLEETEKSITRILEESKKHEQIIIIGAPVSHEGNLYNTAIVILKGEILGIVPKTYLPNYNEYYEKRWFHSAHDMVTQTITYCGFTVPFSPYILFKAQNIPYLSLAIEICIWYISIMSILDRLNISITNSIKLNTYAVERRIMI